MKIQIITKKYVQQTIQLIDSVAREYVYYELSDDGINNFHIVNNSDFLLDKNNIVYIALDNEQVVGVVAFRKPNHISLLFVSSKYHHQGIGKKLINTVLKLSIEDIEVNSSTYALEFYNNIGFKAIDQKQVKDGITYTPMILKREYKNKFKTYDDFILFMEQQKSRVYSLDNFKRFMDDMENPQLLLNTIHVGGTNGKGSTTNYIKEVLRQANYKVATFTSPALYSRLDVMRVNDCFIEDEVIVRYANYYVDLWLKYELSVFEIEVFIAIMYFIASNVDFAIFEVGLGGALDATNIIHPLVALNTNIGLDHIEYLGNNYKDIARTKAGIIKDGVDYITGETKKECLDIFEEICNQKNSQLIKVSSITHIIDGDKIEYDYANYHVVIDTPATYQVANSALALTTLEYLKGKGIVDYTTDNLLHGIYQAKWNGRFDKIHDNPTIIVDGAHNLEGIEAFCNSAKKYKNIKILFSALRDKDTKHMIGKLLELTSDITITQFDHPRMALAFELANGFDVKVDEDYKHAIEEMLNHDGTVFITGSLYFISQVIKYLENK